MSYQASQSNDQCQPWSAQPTGLNATDGYGVASQSLREMHPPAQAFLGGLQRAQDRKLFRALHGSSCPSIPSSLLSRIRYTNTLTRDVGRTLCFGFLFFFLAAPSGPSASGEDAAASIAVAAFAALSSASPASLIPPALPPAAGVHTNSPVASGGAARQPQSTRRAARRSAGSSRRRRRRVASRRGAGAAARLHHGGGGAEGGGRGGGRRGAEWRPGGGATLPGLGLTPPLALVSGGRWAPAAIALGPGL